MMHVQMSPQAQAALQPVWLAANGVPLGTPIHVELAQPVTAKELLGLSGAVPTSFIAVGLSKNDILDPTRSGGTWQQLSQRFGANAAAGAHIAKAGSDLCQVVTLTNPGLSSKLGGGVAALGLIASGFELVDALHQPSAPVVFLKAAAFAVSGGQMLAQLNILPGGNAWGVASLVVDLGDHLVAARPQPPVAVPGRLSPGS
jgi:hypothetical protein